MEKNRFAGMKLSVNKNSINFQKINLHFAQEKQMTLESACQFNQLVCQFHELPKRNILCCRNLILAKRKSKM